MEEVLAPIGNLVFEIERELEEQVGALPLPFTGMDKSGSAICMFHLRGSCQRGSMCPFRHVKPDRTVVCKHWLRGLCKKGDSCEFLHEYDMSKMPECYFYSKFHACSNKECPFLHIDPESKVKDCPWYDRGFCRHGPHCRHRHARRVACINYLCGFCPEGPNCKQVHMRFDIPLQGEGNRGGGERAEFRSGEDRTMPDGTENQNRRMLGPMPTMMGKRNVPICHHCNEPGHKVYSCDKITPEERIEVIAKYQDEKRKNQFQHSYNSKHFHKNKKEEETPLSPTKLQQNSFSHQHSHQNSNQSVFPHQNEMNANNNPSNNTKLAGSGPEGGDGQSTFRPLDQVTCYKCGTKGHYANKCPKGYLAFLSPALNNANFRQQATNNARRPPRNQAYSHSDTNNMMINTIDDASGFEPMDNS